MKRSSARIWISTRSLIFKEHRFISSQFFRISNGKLTGPVNRAHRSEPEKKTHSELTFRFAFIPRKLQIYSQQKKKENTMPFLTVAPFNERMWILLCTVKVYKDTKGASAAPQFTVRRILHSVESWIDCSSWESQVKSPISQIHQYNFVAQLAPWHKHVSLNPKT